MSENVTTYPPLVSVAVAQTILGGRGRGRIYELIKTENIDSVLDGKRRMIISESIFTYIESLEHSQSKETRDATGEGVKT